MKLIIEPLTQIRADTVDKIMSRITYTYILHLTRVENEL